MTCRPPFFHTGFFPRCTADETLGQTTLFKSQSHGCSHGFPDGVCLGNLAITASEEPSLAVQTEIYGSSCSCLPCPLLPLSVATELVAFGTVFMEDACGDMNPPLQ